MIVEILSWYAIIASVVMVVMLPVGQYWFFHTEKHKIWMVIGTAIFFGVLWPMTLWDIISDFIDACVTVWRKE